MSMNNLQPRKKSLLYSCNSLALSFEDADMKSAIQRSRRISKREISKQLREEFQERQKMRRERQLRGLVLGKGLGEKAEKMIFNGFYKPRMALEAHLEDNEGFNAAADSSIPLFSTERSSERLLENTLSKVISHTSISMNRVRFLDSHLYSNPSASLLVDTANSTPKWAVEHGSVENDASRSLVKFQELCAEIRDCIDDLERELDELCEPYPTFNHFLDVLSRALESVECGDLSEEFTLSGGDFGLGNCDIEGLGESTTPNRLVGAEEVMQYVIENMIEAAFELVPVTHTAQWVLQYTVTFLRSLVALTEEDAYLRLELLSRCVRLLASTEHFSATLLTFAFLIEEYNAFYDLITSAENDIGSLFSEIESVLNGVLKEAFPFRRSKLQKVDKVIKAKLQRVIIFINELDSSWSPTIYFHRLWKDTFLSKSFFRIHKVISQRYISCSRGFVDESLYTKIFDSRVTGRIFGTMPSQPQIVLARRIEYERVVEGLSFQQIGMSAKKHSSLVVGYQICMGARYVLRQSTPEFDKAWGFKMNESAKALTAEETDKVIINMTERIKRELRAGNYSRRRATAVFLTQEEV